MKTLTSGALAKIAQTTGTEPVLLLEIKWSTGVKTYSSHTIYGFKSKILKIGNLQTVINIQNKQSGAVTVTLDDTDGEIKSITETVDIHKTPCRVLLSYSTLPVTDAFVLLQGQISAPFTWGEADRTVEFEILTEIESFEVGFSPEEGQLPFVSIDSIGIPWPLSFGSVLQSQTTKVHQTLSGILLEDIGIVDPMLQLQIDALLQQYGDYAVILGFHRQIMESANSIGAPVETLLENYVEIINECHLQFKEMTTVYNDLEKARAREKEKPTEKARKTARTDLETRLTSLANGVSQIESIKSNIEANIDLSMYEYEVKKKAALGQIDAFNNLSRIMGEILQLQQEQCRQGKLVKTSFQIQDGNLFPQDTTTEITVNGVKYRGTFSDTIFTPEVGPYAKYGEIPVATWVPDDDPCQPTDENNGLSTFYLASDPPEALSGLYMLVEHKDGSRHVIKCQRQQGSKVIFELIQYNTPDGNPSGLDINKLLGKVQDLFSLSNDRDILSPTGRVNPRLSMDSSLYFRPETQRLFQIIGFILQFSRDHDLSIKPELTDAEAGDLLTIIFGPNWDTRFPTTIAELTTDDVNNLFKQYYGVTLREVEYLSKAIFTAPSDTLSDEIIFSMPDARRVFTIIGEDIAKIVSACGVPLDEWFRNNYIPLEEWPTDMKWTAEAGTVIRQNNDDCLIYIVNILPSTIHGVHAYRTTKQGKRILSPVPSDYYTKNESANLGTIDVTCLIFPKALSTIDGENWEDDVYVTMTSSVGPHVCDVLEHLITTYIPGASCDFDDVRSALDNYPVAFTLLDRPNVLDELARIAWESRCTLIRNGLVFGLKYLSTEPDEDVTFDESDVVTESFKIDTTPSENLTTRIIATYNENYLPLLPHKHLPRYVLRNNIKKYALHSRDEYFHIYNVGSLVKKSAQFWLIRDSNTWKSVSVQTTLKNVRLDLWDTILFDMELLASKSIITNCDLDFENKIISITAWLPIRSGETTPYIFAWPSDPTTPFPLPIEEQEGLAGGYGPGSGVTGTIPGC